MYQTTVDGVLAAELSNVTKSFGKVKALDNVNLQVRQGETVAVLGPNGAGKTTAISLMLGLRGPTSGTVSLLGQNPREPSSRKRTGVMLQESGVPESIKVREILELFRRLYQQPMSVEAALKAAGLEEKAGAKVGNLSGGQKQRLYFALAIIGNPDVLFLDEPTVGLDVESRRGFWEQIDTMVDEGKTMVLTTHYLEEADALADRIVVIDHGQIIAEGSPAAIKARVGGKTVRFRAAGLDEVYLRNLPGVERATITGNQAELYSKAPEATLAQVFRSGIEISELEVVGAGLEEAFISLTTNRKEVLT